MILFILITKLKQEILNSFFCYFQNYLHDVKTFQNMSPTPFSTLYSYYPPSDPNILKNSDLPQTYQAIKYLSVFIYMVFSAWSVFFPIVFNYLVNPSLRSSLIVISLFPLKTLYFRLLVDILLWYMFIKIALHQVFCTELHNFPVKNYRSWEAMICLLCFVSA